eukprot:SAG11_NODE_6028_length_1406_cov_1.592961_1_plen_457_part_10
MGAAQPTRALLSHPSEEVQGLAAWVVASLAEHAPERGLAAAVAAGCIPPSWSRCSGTEGHLTAEAALAAIAQHSSEWAAAVEMAQRLIVDQDLLASCTAADGASVDLGPAGGNVKALDGKQMSDLCELLTQNYPGCATLSFVGVALEAAAGDELVAWLTAQSTTEITVVLGSDASNALELRFGATCASLHASSKALGPAELAVLTCWLQSPAVAASIALLDVSQNPIRADGARALAEALLLAPRLQTVVVGSKATRVPVHDSDITALDLSNEDVGVAEATMVAASLGVSAVRSLTLSSRGGAGGGPKSYTLTVGAAEVDLAEHGLGPVDLYVLAELLHSKELASTIKSLTVSSTGKPREPKTYTIAAGMSELNLSNMNLGPVDAVLISSLMASAFGKKLIAAISLFDISGNFVFGGKDSAHVFVFSGNTWNKFVHDVDKDQTGFAAICDALSGCSEL